MPTFWLALICLYVFFFKLDWVPGGGRLNPGVLEPPHVTGFYTVDALVAGQWSTLWDAMRHLVLPAIVLALFNIGLLTRYTRSAVLEVIEEEYVQAARAKGLPERVVVMRHVLRAAMTSLVTVIGLAFANVMTGRCSSRTSSPGPGSASTRTTARPRSTCRRSWASACSSRSSTS